MRLGEMDSTLSLWLQLETGKYLPNLKHNKAEKNEEKCVFENDLVIAPKYEPLLYNLNSPNGLVFFNQSYSEISSLSQWMLLAA